MVTPESFPGRPLKRSEIDAIEEHEKVESLLPYAEAGGPGGDEVLQFLVQIEGEYIGLDFDPAAHEWREVSRAPTWEEASTGLTENRSLDSSTL